MEHDAADRSQHLLERARTLIPPEGTDFGAIVRDHRAEATYLARVRPLLHPGFQTVWRHSPAGSESHTGLDATITALHEIGRAFESLVSSPELYVALEDSVLVLVRREGQMLDGTRFAEEGAVIYTFEAGLLRWMEMYAERALAFADAGITEEEARRRGVPP